MDKIFTALSNPVWWFSVVIAGVAINLLSSYLKGALDNFLSRTFSWWRNRSEARKKAWEERVNSLASNKDDREMAIANEARIRLRAIYHILLSIIILYLLPDPLLQIFFVLPFFPISFYGENLNI